MYSRKSAYRNPPPIYSRLNFGNFGRGGSGGPKEMGIEKNSFRRGKVAASKQNSSRFTMPPRSKPQNDYNNFDQYQEINAKNYATKRRNAPSFRKDTQIRFGTNKCLNRRKVVEPRAFAQHEWETSIGQWDNNTTSYRPKMQKKQNFNIPQKISSKKQYEIRTYNNPETFPQYFMGKNGKSYSYDYNWSTNGKQGFQMHGKSSARLEDKYYQPRTYNDYDNTGKRSSPKQTRDHARNPAPMSCYTTGTSQKEMAVPTFYGREYYKNSYHNQVSFRSRRTISNRADFYHYLPDERTEGYKPNYQAAYNYSYPKRHINNASWADSENNYYSKPITFDRICIGHGKTDCWNKGVTSNRRIFSDNPPVNSYEQQWMLAHQPTPFYKNQSPVFMTMHTACIRSVSPQNSFDGYRLLHSQSVRNHGMHSRNAQALNGCNKMLQSFCNRSYKQQYVVSPHCMSKCCPNASKHCNELPFTETLDLDPCDEEKYENMKGFCQKQKCSPEDKDSKLLHRKEVYETEDSVEENKGKSKNNAKAYALPQIVVIGRETSETKTYIQEICKALKLSTVCNTNNEYITNRTLIHSAPTLIQKADKEEYETQNDENEQQLRILHYVDSSQTAIKDFKSDRMYVLSDSKTNSKKKKQVKVHEKDNYKLQQKVDDSDDKKVKIKDSIVKPFINDNYQTMGRGSFARDNNKDCLKNKNENFAKGKYFSDSEINLKEFANTKQYLCKNIKDNGYILTSDSMAVNFPMTVKNYTEESQRSKDPSKNELRFFNMPQKQLEDTILLPPKVESPTFKSINSNSISIQNQENVKNTSKHQATPYPKRLSKHRDSDYLALPPSRSNEFVALDSQLQIKPNSKSHETSRWEDDMNPNSSGLPSPPGQKAIGYLENSRSRNRPTPYPKCQKSNKYIKLRHESEALKSPHEQTKNMAYNSFERRNQIWSHHQSASTIKQDHSQHLMSSQTKPTPLPKYLEDNELDPINYTKVLKKDKYSLGQSVSTKDQNANECAKSNTSSSKYSNKISHDQPSSNNIKSSTNKSHVQSQHWIDSELQKLNEFIKDTDFQVEEKSVPKLEEQNTCSPEMQQLNDHSEDSSSEHDKTLIEIQDDKDNKDTKSISSKSETVFLEIQKGNEKVEFSNNLSLSEIQQEHKEISESEHEPKNSTENKEKEIEECSSDAKIHERNKDLTNAAAIRQPYYFIDSSSSELQSGDRDIHDKDEKSIRD